MDHEDMMDRKETVENWSVDYVLRDRDEHVEIRALRMSWENRPLKEVKANLNSMFVALGIALKVVDAE